jgi:hypothetical protein
MRGIRYGVMLAAAAALLCLSPGRGAALSLGDVDSFDSLNGQLTFSNFEVVATGSLSSLDLTSILIVPTPSGFGFDLVGPISANDGEIGDLLVRFDVWAVLPIVRALLSFNGAASEPGSGATVTETFEGLNVQAFVFATGGGGLDLSDEASIPDLEHLRVTKDILVDSSTLSGAPGSAVISVITQDFALIPEPATVLLVLLGLGATLVLRRRV